jgi:urea transport system substrate-binding protein
LHADRKPGAPGTGWAGWRWLALGALVLLVALAAMWWGRGRAQAPIRVGVLHSLTGTMAVSEKPLVDGVRLAVEEINAQGGLLGRPLELVVADGRSDNAVFAAEAERLISREHVSVLFACWTSACRKAVRPVVERHDHLMFYPVQYEGLELSRNIVYTGAAPNQQIMPGTRWALERWGKRVYLVGSDYVFPRTANRIIRDMVVASGGEVLGERYLPLGSADVAAVLADIRRLKPDVVLNTINGDSNAAFFKGLRAAGLERTPLMSFSVTEDEMKAFGGAQLPEHYAVWGYFQSLADAENRRFVAAFQRRFGAGRTTSDPVEAAYSGVYLWAQAVRQAGSAEPRYVNRTILDQTLRAPSGIMAVDGDTRHVWKMMRVGKVEPDGQFREVFAVPYPLRPSPFPSYRTIPEWTDIAAKLRGEGAP